MRAAGPDNQEAVELLLKLGARRDLKNVSGKTALDYARDLGRTDLVFLPRISGIVSPSECTDAIDTARLCWDKGDS
jgi:hypothetical protein